MGLSASDNMISGWISGIVGFPGRPRTKPDRSTGGTSWTFAYMYIQKNKVGEKSQFAAKTLIQGSYYWFVLAVRALPNWRTGAILP